ncbi:MAG: DUF502 domain-containing protein [Pseudomonadota bacterium]|nr:DUF502 domain-containing protein [Pseudomonadota bacterium]MEE3069953.1 DUF502 domain-containing protein [Pseudomonadota bacterium]
MSAKSFLTAISGPASTFVAGLLVLLPLALTFAILGWLAGWISRLIGPGSWFGQLLSAVGSGVVGTNHQTVAFLIGLTGAVLLVWGLGLVARTGARAALSGAIDRLVGRFPIVRGIYKPVAQVVRLLSEAPDTELSGLSVVSCRLGGPMGVDLLGLLTSHEIYIVDGEQRRMVYVPTAPVPMSGGLLMVPVEAVRPVPDMSADDLMQIYLSLGLAVPEGLSRARPQDATLPS